MATKSGLLSSLHPTNELNWTSNMEWCWIEKKAKHKEEEDLSSLQKTQILFLNSLSYYLLALNSCTIHRKMTANVCNKQMTVFVFSLVELAIIEESLLCLLHWPTIKKYGCCIKVSCACIAVSLPQWKTLETGEVATCRLSCGYTPKLLTYI